MATAQRGEVHLFIKVIPGAKHAQIVGILELPDGPRLKLKVTAPPEDGRANEAVCELLCARLGLARQAVRIERGHAGREKVVALMGTGVDQVLAALGLKG